MISQYHLWLHLKNSLGAKAPQGKKVVVFLVDDYGNARLDSRESYESLKKQGYIDDQNRFDRYDTLETTSDLEQLFEVLQGVKDQRGKPAVFTPMALSANLDFAALRQYGYDRYRYETVVQTFARKAAEDPQAYRGAWELLHEAIRSGIFLPQFHGREHLNVAALESLLKTKNAKLLANFKEKSLVGGRYPTKSGLLVAFDFYDPSEKEKHPSIVREGASLFEQAYGYAPVLFTSPGAYAYKGLEPALAQAGIKAIDTYFTGKEHQGGGQYHRKWHFHGQRNKNGQAYLLRNVVFEPTSVEQETDEVAKAISEIEIAFHWGKPAIISSHRVNFCGHIDPANRKKGLLALKLLLHQIVKKWPEVEFWSGGELVQQMTSKK